MADPVTELPDLALPLPTSQLTITPTSTSVSASMVVTRPSPVASTSRLARPPSPPRVQPSSLGHDPSGWQVVLRKPQQGKVVLFHAQLNELSVRNDDHYLDHTQVEGGGHGGSASSSRSNSSVEVGLELISTGKVKGVTRTRRREPERASVCPLCLQSVPRSQRSDTTTAPQHDNTWPTSSYFQLLSTANTPRSSYSSQAPIPDVNQPEEELNATTLCDGYYAQYFDEVQLLGRGGQGAVYLAAHVLNGERLGMYAVKKGRSLLGSSCVAYD